MRVGALGLAVAVTVAAGCSKSAPEEPVFALYGAQGTTRLSPYPSNRYTRLDAASKTGLRVDLRAETTADPMLGAFASTVTALDTLDGFSTVGPIIVTFSKEIDPASSEAAMALVDVDDTSPGRGQRIALLPVYYTTTDSDSTVDDYTLLVQPQCRCDSARATRSSSAMS